MSRARLLLGVVSLVARMVYAGGGPENVLLVVNGDSPVSAQVANFYVHLRDIPPEHVIRLHNIPYPVTIPIDTFRTRIWKPIHDFITEHRLGEEIDIIAYSADFPYAVEFCGEVRCFKLPSRKYTGRIASLTGLTYFARRVAIRDPHYIAFNGNRYFRRNLAPAYHLPRALTDAESKLQRDAEKAFNHKEFPVAVKKFTALTRGFPEHGGLWFELARSHAAAGSPSRAMTALEQAVNYGWTSSVETRSDPYLATLRDKPEFQQVLRRMDESDGPFQKSYGFSSRYEWTGAARPVEVASDGDLDRYYLSTMLAYTGAGGNSVPEVENYLASAARSDGTQPDGTVYMLASRNIRSRTRQPLFPETVEELEKRGRRAEILTGALPRGKNDVIGAVVGSQNFNWKASGSRLLPGAIAENLTSYGGILNSSGGQTKLTEFLRYGAAGSSGTVTEPYSIQAKFPTPLLHVYYADGCSLAEAFYQSVEAPYQLLVVGDPLARPFARFARVQLTSPDPRTPWSGVVTLLPTVIPAPGRSIGQMELWVDGQLTAYALPNKPIPWDTRSLDDGYHDVRLVAVESDPVETRSYIRVAVTLANTGHRLEVGPINAEVRYGEAITLSGKAARATQVDIWQGTRRLATTPVITGRWQVRLPSQQLGIGPVVLSARAHFPDGSVVRSAPLRVKIGLPELRASPQAISEQDASRDGVHAKMNKNDKKGLIRLSGKLGKLAKAKHLRMSGEFAIQQAGFYQVVVQANGAVSLNIDDNPPRSIKGTGREQPAFVPLGLARGTHHLEVEYVPDNKKPFLSIILEGDQAAIVPEVKLRPNSAAPQGDDAGSNCWSRSCAD